jgi:16S rRNA (cytosine1407-C5)-methyltransferase
MMPVLCLDLQPGQKILDMAAAPGSKTTQIASILRGKCQITALEKFGIRHEKLLHTLKLQGAEECVEVVKMDAIDFSKTATETYDRILLDAPCSSDGRINLSDERTYKWYSEEKSKSKAELQLQMLEAASQLLSPTGKIVYSTCSLSR